MAAELYKSGIISIDENIDFSEEEELWDIEVHFNGEIFIPHVCGVTQNDAFGLGEELYDWLEENYRHVKGFYRFSDGRLLFGCGSEIPGLNRLSYSHPYHHAISRFGATYSGHYILIIPHSYDCPQRFRRRARGRWRKLRNGCKCRP